MKKAYVIGTCDTKHPELDYVKRRIVEAGVPAVLVDVGIFPAKGPVDVKNTEVATAHPSNPRFLEGVDDRGKAVIAMSEALEVWLSKRDDLGGVIGLGGTGGTSLITRGMRALSIGVPKLMVSTVASGNVAPYVGPNDISMMYSVTDIAGLNVISRSILANAAHALAGMIKNAAPQEQDAKPLLGMTQFGVTTPCVEQIRELTKDRFEPLVFHATGTGGQSFEKLVDSGMVVNVIDLTLTEVCDLFMGGVMSAGEDRLGAFARTRIPWVGSVGALDMVNFDAMDTVPVRYRERKLHVHNANVTLMRTTPEENAKMGKWIAGKLNRCEGPVRLLLPLRGVSAIDAEGGPFWWPEADKALFSAIEENLSPTSERKLLKVDAHINDPAFAAALLEAFQEIHR